MQRVQPAILLWRERFLGRKRSRRRYESSPIGLGLGLGLDTIIGRFSVVIIVIIIIIIIISSIGLFMTIIIIIIIINTSLIIIIRLIRLGRKERDAAGLLIPRSRVNQGESLV